jgi:ABC-type uncharacterized transport system involved in gliding motility auxiliary subunit
LVLFSYDGLLVSRQRGGVAPNQNGVIKRRFEMIDQSTKEKALQVALSLLSMCFILYIGSTLLKRVDLDFTEEGLYTLSPGTRSLLKKVDRPVKLKLYYSKTAANKGTEGLRTFNIHFEYVREFLEEMTAHSGNYLTLEVIDPRPDTAEEEDAIAYGLRKFQLSETERYFFGLVAINETGSESVIEFFDPGQRDKLEYDLAKLIHQAQDPAKKTLGILSSLDIITEQSNPYLSQIQRLQGKSLEESWLVSEMAKEFFDVREISKDTKEIHGVDVLAVVHPKGFSEQTLFAIDQFLLKGGQLMVFVDPHTLADTEVMTPYSGQFSQSPDEGFQKLMDKWGIHLAAGEFVGDRYLSGVARLGPGQAPTRMIGLVNCDHRCTSTSRDAITSGLDQLTFVYPGALKVEETEGVRSSVLLTTSDRGSRYQASPFELNSPQRLWEKIQEGVEPVPLAYRLTGTFKTAFPRGAPSVKEEKKKVDKDKPKAVAESQKPSTIIVFPDVDFLTNQFAFKNTFLGMALANNNSHLFLNTAEALSGDQDLLSIRSKGRRNRGFTTIDAIEFQAEKKTAMKVNEIQTSISKYQAELNELGQKANSSNIALIQNEGLRKRKELSKKIAELKGELREVKREGREKVERIGASLQYLNTLAVPLIAVIFGVWYNRRRRSWLKPQVAEAVQVRNSENAQTIGGQV